MKVNSQFTKITAAILWSFALGVAIVFVSSILGCSAAQQAELKALDAKIETHPIIMAVSCDEIADVTAELLMLGNAAAGQPPPPAVTVGLFREGIRATCERRRAELLASKAAPR